MKFFRKIKNYIQRKIAHFKHYLNKKNYKSNGYEYRGIKWINGEELPKNLGKSNRYVDFNIRNGKTYEELIDKSINDKTSR